MGVKDYIKDGIKQIDDEEDEQPSSERKIIKEPPSRAPLGEPTPEKPLKT